MYRFGLIGYGAMGNYHAQQIGTMPDFAVSAVYDIAPEKERKHGRRAAMSAIRWKNCS